jgi:predicted phosphoadenosine phosphosulfate sulfurtransferase
MQRRIARYLQIWAQRGYPKDIPDEVPPGLMHGLAPSYKAVAFAILRNDTSCRSLGFIAEPSPWYLALKRVEREERAATRARGA